MSIITLPVLSVTAFEGTSLERKLSAAIDVSVVDSLQLAIADCLLQAQAIEEAAGVELHIAELEKKQGKKLTKPQRELVTLSYNIVNGVEEDEPSNETPDKEEKEEEEEPAKEEPSSETGAEEVEASIEPEASIDPVADAVKEVAYEVGTNSDEATDAALAALGL